MAEAGTLEVTELDVNLDDELKCMGWHGTCPNPASWILPCSSCGYNIFTCNRCHAEHELRTRDWPRQACRQCFEDYVLPLPWRPI